MPNLLLKRFLRFVICVKRDIQNCLSLKILQQGHFQRNILLEIIYVELEARSTGTEELLSDVVNRLCVLLP